MYRYQFHIQVQLGKWREFHAVLKELNVAMLGKGLIPFQLWEAKFGRFDDALMVADYESLEAYEREYKTLHGDMVCMSLWREMGKYVDGIPWTDLWWTPSEAGQAAQSARIGDG